MPQKLPDQPIIQMWSSRHAGPDLPRKRKISTVFSPLSVAIWSGSSLPHTISAWFLSNLFSLCNCKEKKGEKKKRKEEKINPQKSHQTQCFLNKGQYFKSICTYWNRKRSMKGMGWGRRERRETHTAFRNLTTYLDYSISYKKFTHFFWAVTLHIWLSL